MLKIRKVADRRGVVDPAQPPPKLPLRGIRVIGTPPTQCLVPTSFVDRGVREGWIRLGGERRVHRPGGPPDDQWRVTHTFTHADTITLVTLDGDVAYRVTHQPDKYVASTDPTEPVTPEIYRAGATRVDHFYKLALES